MRQSIKLLIVAVFAVAFMFAAQNSAFADVKSGKSVSFKDKDGSYFKFYNQASKGKTVLKQKFSEDKKPFNSNNRPTRKMKVYSIASSNDNNFIQVYLGKLKRTLRAYKY